MPVVCERPCTNHKVKLLIHGERGAHQRAHVHIRGPGWKVSVALDTFEELARTGRPHQPDLDEALATAARCIDKLREKWSEYNARD